MKLAWTLTLASLLSFEVLGAGMRVCYYTNWSQYRPGDAAFAPENIDTSLCSHIIYAFADMEGNRLVTKGWDDVKKYVRVNALKKTSPQLRTLLSVGGRDFNLTKMTNMLATEENRQTFIGTSIKFLRRHHFDGLDLDFEYPGSNVSPPEDKIRYTMLCEELRRAVNREAVARGQTPLLITSAVPSGKIQIDNGYEISQVCLHVDYALLMAYDMSFTGLPRTALHSALYPRSDQEGWSRYENLEWAAGYWHDGGCPKDKLVIGMPMYGHGWTLADPDDNGVGAPWISNSPPGDFTKQAGVLSYFEICELLVGGNQVMHPEHQVPYTYRGTTWLGHDNADSLRNKVTWLIGEGYAGWMIWSLDQDDFEGSFCGEGPYPLLTALNEQTETLLAHAFRLADYS